MSGNFNSAASGAAKSLGMSRVARAANPYWVAQMETHAIETARTHQYFTSDDVYARAALSGINVATHDQRAFGPIMLRLAKAGVCHQADHPPVKSQRITLHRSPRCVWESDIYGTNKDPYEMSTTAAANTFSWSYSALKNYETCPRRYYHYNVAKDVKEAESEHIRYGHAVHQAFEARVKHGTPLPMGMGMHEKILSKLADAPGDVYAEQKLAMDHEFQPATWFGKGAWLRTVLDYTNVRDTTATVLDYKTGKVSEDLTQLQLSAAMVFTHVPQVNRVKAGLVFVGYGQVERAEFIRENLTEIWAEILPRVHKLMTAKAENNYPAKPGGLCKRWCGVTSCPYNGK